MRLCPSFVSHKKAAFPVSMVLSGVLKKTPAVPLYMYKYIHTYIHT